MSMALECFQRLHQRILEDNSCETIEVANDADASTLPVLKLPLLHDVLAFISHDIGSKYDRTELMEIVGTLGGRVCIEHCQEVTHFVCQGELAVSEEMRKAKEWNQIFILPQWILDDLCIRTHFGELARLSGRDCGTLSFANAGTFHTPPLGFEP